MVKQGGFWGKIAESAILADEPNLETLVTAFPKLVEGRALEKRWTPQLFICGTAVKLAR